MPVEVNPPEEFRALFTRTNKENPKREDLMALRKALKETELWRLAGEMAEHTIAQIIDRAGRGNAFLIESLREGVRRQRIELAENQDGPLERLLIEQVVVAWLALNTIQHSYDAILEQGSTIRRIDLWERRLGGAHRRFTRSCESLARVRKLAKRGPVQVNVAATGGTFQQVNTT